MVTIGYGGVDVNRFFHILFCFVLSFNIFTCQLKTKMQKLNENVTKPVFSEPLTRPIRVNININGSEQQTIQTEKDLRSFLIETYELPSNWDKKISLAKVKMDKEDQVIALVLTGQETANVEQENVVYLKKQAKHPYLLDSIYKLPNKNGAVLQRVHIQNEGSTLPSKENSVNKKIDEAILQQKKLEKVQSKFSIEQNKHTNQNSVPIIKNDIKVDITSASSEENIELRLREVLLHARDGTVVIFHINQLFGKKQKPLKVKIPEFKSRGFRLNRTYV